MNKVDNEFRVLVCGGREYDDWDTLSYTLTEIFYQGEDLSKPFIVIEGGAIGADFLARVWAKYMSIEYPNITYEEYKADWKKYGRPAGAIRNQQMLDEGKPDLVIAFPGNTGTADMVRRATNAGVEVIDLRE